MRQIKLDGDILDLGSGGTKGSYHRFIAYQEPYKIKYTDLYKNTDNPDTIILDLEKEFPIKENSFDNITCFNVLEHIYNHHNLIGESYRVLKHGAYAILFWPPYFGWYKLTSLVLEKILGIIKRRCVKLYPDEINLLVSKKKIQSFCEMTGFTLGYCRSVPQDLFTYTVVIIRKSR